MSALVFFDVTFLAFGRDLRGIPQVIFQLVRLFREDPAFHDVRYISTPEVTRTFLSQWGIPRELIEEVQALPLLGRYERFHGLLSTFRYRRIAAQASLIIHPELRTVLRSKVPQLIYYHDFIIFERFNGDEGRKWTRYLPYLYKNRQAARVRFKLANSEFTRSRALEIFPTINPASITARHLGIRMHLRAVPREAPLQGAELQLLYVGSYESRKNINALLENLVLVSGGKKVRLHLAGKMSSPRERILKSLAANLPSEIAVEFHGLVSEAELNNLYRNADFLVFPSLFEGFGLPIAEAMAHGIVVCAFRNSCLPEITGDAALLADTGDFGAWGRSIGALADDAESYRGASLLALRRAAEFTEERMHERYREYFLNVFSQVGVNYHAGKS